MIFTKSNGIMTAAILLSLGAAANAFAQQAPQSPGIVRISDGRVRTGMQQPVVQNVQQTGAFGHFGGPIYTEASYPANGGNCPSGNCPSDGQFNGYQVDGGCPSGHCRHCRGCRNGVCGDYYCKHSPGYGYSPPSKYPLLRRGVEYSTYYPTNWYGAGGDYSQARAPMVYQPTDTTQLGFYYQHVPFWQPMPSQLPERPVPAQWHIRHPAMQASIPGGYSSQYGPGGHLGLHLHGHRTRYASNGYDVMSNGAGVMGSCPTNPPGTYQNPSPQMMNSGEVVQPVPRPVDSGSPAVLPMPVESPVQGSEPDALPPTTSVPPSPNGTGSPATTPLPTSSASSGHIRRSSFQY